MSRTCDGCGGRISPVRWPYVKEPVSGTRWCEQCWQDAGDWQVHEAEQAVQVRRRLPDGTYVVRSSLGPESIGCAKRLRDRFRIEDRQTA